MALPLPKSAKKPCSTDSASIHGFRSEWRLTPGAGVAVPHLGATEFGETTTGFDLALQTNVSTPPR